jgi:ankyrin repeat protein
MQTTSNGRRTNGWHSAFCILHSFGLTLVLCAAAAADPAGSSARLIEAVKSGNREAVRALVKDPSEVAATELDGTTPLHWAVRADDLETVRLLLAAGARADAATRHGITPLSLAAVNGNAAVAELLLQAGANANAVLPEGETVLMTAARTGNADVLELLLARGADVHARESWYGETALMWAAAENHPQAIRVLVGHGADVNGRSTLLNVPRRRSGQSILPLGSWTPVMYAARQNAIDAARTLADLGADLNLTDPDGATALVLAIINANYDAAAALVEKGANPNIGDNESNMAALYAAVDMHRLAIGHGRPNTKPSGRLDAVDLVKALLARGADPNARLSAPLMQRHHSAGDRALGEGSTPFMRAAKSGDVAMMRLLLAAGADPKLTQPNQANALMLAAGLGWRDGSPAAPSYDQGSERDAIDAIKLCLEAGLDINATTASGDTALHSAINGRGSDAIIRFLAESGANLQARNKQGRTPLDVAAASRRERSAETVTLLKRLMNQQ